MRVLQVPTYIVYGGLSMHVLTLAAGLKQRGHDVEVLSMCPGPLAPEFEEAGIPLTVVPHLKQKAGRNPLLVAQVIRHVRSLIRDKSPEIVHTHGPRAHYFAGVAAAGAGNHRLLASAHGSYTQFTAGQTRELGRLQKRVTKLMYGGIDRMTARRADRVIAVSEATRDDLVDGLGIDARKVAVIHNGIEEIRVSEAQKAAIRNEFGFTEADQVIACVGRIAHHKGSGYLAAAMKIICSKMPGARFLVVGEGPMKDELCQLVNDGHLAGRAFVTGSRKDAIDIIAAADMLVMPSLSEGLPITLLEAAMTGTAMVASDVGGMPEVVRDGETGLLCSPGDAQGMANAIMSLLGDDQLRQRMGVAARALWEKEFTHEVMVQRMEALYREVCGQVAAP